jgi:hypothetical protein
MRYALVLALIVLAGCSRSPEFQDWREELAYLRAQSNTTPEQSRRREELSRKEDEEKHQEEWGEKVRSDPATVWQDRAYAAYVLLTREEMKLPKMSRRPDSEVKAQANKETQEARYASEARIFDRLRREAEGKPASERPDTQDLEWQAMAEATKLARQELAEISRRDEAELAKMWAEREARREANKKGK